MNDNNQGIQQINRIIMEIERCIGDKYVELEAMNKHRVEFIQHNFYYPFASYLPESYKWLYSKDVNNIEEMRRLKASFEELIVGLTQIFQEDIKILEVKTHEHNRDIFGYEVYLALKKFNFNLFIPVIDRLNVDNMDLAHRGQLTLLIDNETVFETYEPEEMTAMFKQILREGVT